MRLICPNCGAQYEVDPGVIPTAGRDVQCSNCGHGWFQSHPESDGDLAAEMGQTLREEAIEASRPKPPMPETPEPGPDPDPFDDDTLPEPDPAPEPSETAEDGAAPDASDRSEQLEDDDPEEMERTEAPSSAPEVPSGETAPKPAVRPSRPERGRRLDPEVANLLREEAAREAAVRRAETGALETQAELGIEDSAERSTPSPPDVEDAETVAEDTAPSDTTPEGGDARRGSRSGLLPDIDEINSTLRPADATDRAEDAAPAATAPAPLAERRKRGARRGFLLVAGLAVLAVGLYLLSPQIARTVPAAAPVLETYTEWVNGVRPQIDQGVDTSIAQVKGLIESLTGGAETSPEE